MSEPPAIVWIGFVAAPVLHVGSVRKEHPDVWFQQVEDRFAVAPGALHHRVSAALGYQPSGQTLKLANDRAELLDLRVWLIFRSAGHNADDNKLLADIDASHRSRIASIIYSSSADKQPEANWAYCSMGSEEAPVRCT
jgi:hypothetical protein